jgi:hypothetical protein
MKSPKVTKRTTANSVLEPSLFIFFLPPPIVELLLINLSYRMTVKISKSDSQRDRRRMKRLSLVDE